jgi:RNA polymerase sigma-70 factor (ECF subfamily)
MPDVVGLEQFRSYLLLLARAQLAGAAALDPSDLVQQTLLEAHQKRDQFRGKTDAERAGWLRRLLACTVADAWRTLHRDKRDMDRLRSPDESSARLEQWLTADWSSPSESAAKHERIARLADALSRLPEGQREAVELRYFQGAPVADIARRLNRTPAAVAGLLKRGLHQLRNVLREGDV